MPVQFMISTAEFVTAHTPLQIRAKAYMCSILAHWRRFALGVMFLFDITETRKTKNIELMRIEQGYRRIETNCSPSIPLEDKAVIKIKPSGSLTYQERYPRKCYQLRSNKNASTNCAPLMFAKRPCNQCIGVIVFEDTNKRVIHSFPLGEVDVDQGSRSNQNREHPTLSDKSLKALWRSLTESDWQLVAIELGIPHVEVCRIWEGHKASPGYSMLQMLKGRRSGGTDDAMLDAFESALRCEEHTDIAERLADARRKKICFE
ncbi:uncharacterized protein LOC125382904 [Haliotis rufescens]|uniref:uncharacterized protein LOC125382904 n=1 Tax=Haliotis rufescens TaxID=6454 RepID=UPI00201F7B1E|nr:uncharacterized protein LOC125382904 [Haliotis rufescens]